MMCVCVNLLHIQMRLSPKEEHDDARKGIHQSFIHIMEIIE